jgi:hypothetical protein
MNHHSHKLVLWVLSLHPFYEKLKFFYFFISYFRRNGFERFADVLSFLSFSTIFHLTQLQLYSIIPLILEG